MTFAGEVLVCENDSQSEICWENSSLWRRVGFFIDIMADYMAETIEIPLHVSYSQPKLKINPIQLWNQYM